MKRLFVRVFFVSVALNAALAIYALLVGSFGHTEGKILMSSLSVTGAVILTIACEAARERGRLGPLPRVGAAAAVAGFALLIVSIWAEQQDTWVVQLVGTLLTVATAAALLSLLSLAALAPRFRWTFRATVVLAALLASLLVSSIWGNLGQYGWFQRWFGVVAVGLAAFAVVVPVLHRLSRRTLAAPPEAGAPERVSFCPSCGRPVSAEAGQETACPACGAVFAVRFGRP